MEVGGRTGGNPLIYQGGVAPRQVSGAASQAASEMKGAEKSRDAVRVQLSPQARAAAAGESAAPVNDAAPVGGAKAVSGSARGGETAKIDGPPKSSHAVSADHAGRSLRPEAARSLSPTEAPGKAMKVEQAGELGEVQSRDPDPVKGPRRLEDEMTAPYVAPQAIGDPRRLPAGNGIAGAEGSQLGYGFGYRSAPSPQETQPQQAPPVDPADEIAGSGDLTKWTLFQGLLKNW